MVRGLGKSPTGTHNNTKGSASTGTRTNVSTSGCSDRRRDADLQDQEVVETQDAGEE